MIDIFPQGNIDFKISKDLYDKVISDRSNYDSLYLPANPWQLYNRRDVSLDNEGFINADDMRRMWSGGRALNKAGGEVGSKYISYITSKFGHEEEIFKLLGSFPIEELRYFELGTLLDVAVILSFSKVPKKRPFRILEIGGGFGRTAEAILSLFGKEVNYVIVDTVPESLLMAEQYLKERFSHLKIGSYYTQEYNAWQSTACFILPSWHIEEMLEKEYFDITVSIAAFQEMSDWHVEHYLKVIQRCLRRNGIIYFSHSRDYVYERNYIYPSNWELIMKENTPRSWSPYYPIEILQKKRFSSRKGNAIIEAKYLSSIIPLYQRQIKALREKNKTLKKQKKMLKQKIKELRDLNLKLSVQKKKLKMQIRKIQDD